MTLLRLFTFFCHFNRFLPIIIMTPLNFVVIYLIVHYNLPIKGLIPTYLCCFNQMKTLAWLRYIAVFFLAKCESTIFKENIRIGLISSLEHQCTVCMNCTLELGIITIPGWVMRLILHYYLVICWPYESQYHCDQCS